MDIIDPGRFTSRGGGPVELVAGGPCGLALSYALLLVAWCLLPSRPLRLLINSQPHVFLYRYRDMSLLSDLLLWMDDDDDAWTTIFSIEPLFMHACMCLATQPALKFFVFYKRRNNCYTSLSSSRTRAQYSYQWHK